MSVEPTDADKALLTELMKLCGDMSAEADQINAGGWDKELSLIAAHRHQAEEAMRERCAKVAQSFEQQTDDIIAQEGFDGLESGPRLVIGCLKQTAAGIAAAIRGMEVE